MLVRDSHGIEPAPKCDAARLGDKHLNARQYRAGARRGHKPTHEPLYEGPAWSDATIVASRLVTDEGNANLKAPTSRPLHRSPSLSVGWQVGLEEVPTLQNDSLAAYPMQSCGPVHGRRQVSTPKCAIIARDICRHSGVPPL